MNVSVLATREEHTVNEFHGADESTFVYGDGALAVSIFAVPHVDLGVGTTGVAGTIVTPGNAGEGCHCIGSKDTLSLVHVWCIGIPEVDVLGSASSEFVGLRAETNVVDLVGVSLDSADLTPVSCLEHVDPVIVGEIDATDQRAVVVEGNGVDTSGSLGKLDTALLITSNSVPAEDSWRGANLSGTSD